MVTKIVINGSWTYEYINGTLASKLDWPDMEWLALKRATDVYHNLKA
jgi:hypothetical protein